MHSTVLWFCNNLFMIALPHSIASMFSFTPKPTLVLCFFCVCVFSGFQGSAEAESRTKNEAAIIQHRDKGSQGTRSPNIMKQTSLYSWLLSILGAFVWLFHLRLSRPIFFVSNVMFFYLSYNISLLEINFQRNLGFGMCNSQHQRLILV